MVELRRGIRKNRNSQIRLWICHNQGILLASTVHGKLTIRTMRIAGGHLKGRTLAAPHTDKTRPTTEKVRSALFDILQTDLRRPFTMLDICAGSGAVVSRRSPVVPNMLFFIENNRTAAKVIRSNATNLAVSSATTILAKSAKQAMEHLTKSFDLVFLDPPYYQNLADEILAAMCELPFLATDAIVATEHSSKDTFPDRYEGSAGELTLRSRHRYGDSALTMYIWTAQATVKQCE